MRRHADLVKRIAYHLAGRLPPQVEVDDLIQAGMIGLLEAAQHYTTGRGASFETYAGIRIRGAMLDALRKLDWAPRSVHRKARAAAAALRAVEAARGGEATDTEVAAHMGVSLGDYHQHPAGRAGLPAAAAQRQRGRRGVGARPPAPTMARTRSSETLDDSAAQAVIAAIERLPERERLVLSLYYEQELNLKEIGAVLKVTESRVCQLHGQALVRLQVAAGRVARVAGWRSVVDLLSVIGLLLALVAIIVGAILKGAGVQALLSAAAFMIVVVGTIAAICVQTPLAVMRRAFIILPWVFLPPMRAPEAQIRKIVEWSNLSRKQGLLGLEPLLAGEPDHVPAQGPAAGGRRQRAGDDPQHARSRHGRARERRPARRQGVRGHGHLLADARHHRRRAGPDGGDAESRRSVQARTRASPRPSSPPSMASASRTCSSCRSPTSSSPRSSSRRTCTRC